MNYLSHYYLDKEDQRPYFVFGLILPDLVKRFGRLPHSSFKKNLREPNLKEIQEGAQKHFLADKIFHQNYYFTIHVEKIKQELQKHDFDSITNKKFFLAHLLLEMLLDRIIVKEHPHFARTFYEKLEQVEKKVLIAYFKKISYTGRIKEFFEAFERFLSSRYLLQYKYNKTFIFSLNRICCSINLYNFTKRDELLLYEVIEKAEKEIKKDFEQIFEAIRTELNE